MSSDSMFIGLSVIAMFIFGFMVGRDTVKFPEESEMFERLVQLRCNRKIAASTKSSLEDELEQKAKARAMRT